MGASWWDVVRSRVAGFGWWLFLFASRIKAEDYWLEIYEQERNRRKEENP
jgi:hypothetical protein